LPDGFAQNLTEALSVHDTVILKSSLVDESGQLTGSRWTVVDSNLFRKGHRSG